MCLYQIAPARVTPFHDICCVGLQSTHKIKACFVAAASKYNQVCELRCIYIYLSLMMQRCTD